MTKQRSNSLGMEQRVVDFAEDLGRILGSAQKKASDWIGQRQIIVKQLQQVQTTAGDLLRQLTGATSVTAARRRGRPVGSKNSASGTREAPGLPKARKMSIAARKAISDAQKKRWAKQKGALKA